MQTKTGLSLGRRVGRRARVGQRSRGSARPAAPILDWETMRRDPEAAVAAGVPLVLSVGARVCGRRLRPGVDDEYSVGLAALLEAGRSFRPELGVPFPAFAALVIRRRLVDQYRRARRRREIPLSSCEVEDDDGAMRCPPETAAALAQEGRRREAGEAREDVADFGRLLAPFGLTLADVRSQSPAHADSRARAIAVAQALAADPGWMASVRHHGRLPLRALQSIGAALGMGRKTMERRRRYILAVALILSGNVPSLRAHLPLGCARPAHGPSPSQ